MSQLHTLRVLMQAVPDAELTLSAYLDPADHHLIHTDETCPDLSAPEVTLELDCHRLGDLRLCPQCEHWAHIPLTEGATPWDANHVMVLRNLFYVCDVLEESARDVESLAAITIPAAGPLAVAIARLPGSLGDVEGMIPHYGGHSPLLTEAAAVLMRHTATLQRAFRARLEELRAPLLAHLRLVLSHERGATELLEFEDDEVLVGYQPETRASDEVRALLALGFGIRVERHLVVLAGPRFLTQLLWKRTRARIDTAPRPRTLEAAHIAAQLWDPNVPTALGSLTGALRTAEDTLTLAS